MSCDSYENCYKQELHNMEFPTDNESLYADKIYDKQTARNTCYNAHPISIVEGFGSLSWNTIIKVLIVILLIYLAYVLGNEFVGKKVEHIGGFVDSPSPFYISEYK